MTNEIDRLMAEARGWKLARIVGREILYEWWWVNEKGVQLFRVLDYHPSENLAQAMEALEEYDCWEIRRYHKKDYRCRINDEELTEGPRSETIARAVCETVLKARGVEVEPPPEGEKEE